MNPFNVSNSNIGKIKTHHHQIMTTITNRVLKFEPQIKKAMVAIIHSLLLSLIICCNKLVKDH